MAGFNPFTLWEHAFSLIAASFPIQQYLRKFSSSIPDLCMVTSNMAKKQKRNIAFNHAKFSVGQMVSHLLFDYRGVIIDIDAVYSRSEEWYNRVALTKPPKDKPWYCVLVHDAVHETYVSERNLQADTSAEPVDHPLVDNYFNEFNGESYITSRQIN